jgi:hypothetical protein
VLQNLHRIRPQPGIHSHSSHISGLLQVSQEKALPVRMVKWTYILFYRITPAKKQSTLFLPPCLSFALFPRAHSVLPFCITFPVSNTPPSLLQFHPTNQNSPFLHLILSCSFSNQFQHSSLSFRNPLVLWKIGLFLSTLADSVLLRPERGPLYSNYRLRLQVQAREPPITHPSRLT